MKSYLLVVRAQGAQEKLKQGTGWLVRPDIVVTAFHVVGVEAMGEWLHRGPYADVTYHLRIGSHEVALEPLVFDSSSDVALLRLSQAFPESVVALATKEPPRHARWHGVGYPGIHHGEPFTLSGWAINTSDDASSQLQLTIDQRAQVEWSGFSGSPVFVDERVVGVLTAVTGGTDTAWAAPVVAVRRLAQQCGVTADLLDGQNEHASDVRALKPWIPATAVLRGPSPLGARFEKEPLPPEWFRHRFDEVKADLDQRYKPEMHVDVQVQHALDALVRNSTAAARFDAGVKAVAKRWRGGFIEQIAALLPEAGFEAAQAAVRAVGDAARDVVITGLGDLGLGAIASAVDNALSRLSDLRTWIVESLREIDNSADAATRPETTRERRYALLSAWRWLGRVSDELTALKEQFEGPLHFASDPFLVLTGEAGIGKSHLLAHLVATHLELSAPAVMLLGQYFESGDPWRQVIGRLGLNYAGADALLGALDAAAGASGHRALLVIDALNEHGRHVHRMWSQNLAGMRTTARRYRNVAFVVSVRTPFEEAVLPEALRAGPHVVKHRGFAGREGEAVARFFDAFQLPPPRTPLLLPEYANPLFLLLYCDALYARHAGGQPPILRGFIEVLSAWIDAVAKRVDDRLGTDPYERIVHRGIEALASELVETDGWTIPRARAKVLLQSIHPAAEYQNSLLKALIDETVLVETDTTHDGEPTVRLQYERIRDHLVARALIQRHVRSGSSLASVGSHSLLVRAWAHSSSEIGLLEALSIVLPVEHSLELVDIAPPAGREIAIKATLDALPWRPAGSVSSKLVGLVREALCSANLNVRWAVLESLLLVASEPEHPLNARFMHGWLIAMAMPDRDAHWSAVLLIYHDKGTATDRLIRWVQVRNNFSDLDDQVRYLLGLMLGWFLSTSRRILRDQATKALVRLFVDRLDLLERWMIELSEVNDLYVIERVLAVAYGAIVRAKNPGGVGRVASMVYERWFLPGPAPLHLLARDYARNIIEYAKHIGELHDNIDMARVRPPYESVWPEPVSSLDELKERFGPHSQLLASMVGGGDFDRYIVGSNTWQFPWRNLRLGQPKPPTAEEVISAFEATLSAEQKAAWVNFRKHRKHYGMLGEFEELGELLEYVQNQDFNTLRSEAEAAAHATRQELEQSLDTNQRLTFTADVLDALAGRFRNKWDFPLELVQRQLLHRVIELGWEDNRLGAFDRAFSRGRDEGRTAHKFERLGKKYQWIALHQFLATISDNFAYHRGSNDPDKDEAVYDGPWQIHRRDIDPTCFLSRTQADSFDHSTTWWSPVSYDGGRDMEPDDYKWLITPQSLPDPRDLLEVRSLPDGPSWFALDVHRDWRETLPDIGSNVPLPERTVYYWIRAYLVRAEHLEAVFAWAREQNFFGRWMPEVKEETPQLMLRERGWSPAWRCFDIPWHGRPGWSTGSKDHSIPHPVLPSWDYYMAEGSTHDCSVEEGYTLHLPCPELVAMLGLLHSQKDGHFMDAEGKLAAFDPTVDEAGPGALLLRTDQLEILRSQGLEIVWTLLGEQQVFEVLHGHPKKHRGTVELSGAFVRRSSGWEGSLRVIHRVREETQESQQEETQESQQEETQESQQEETQESQQVIVLEFEPGRESSVVVPQTDEAD